MEKAVRKRFGGNGRFFGERLTFEKIRDIVVTVGGTTMFCCRCGKEIDEKAVFCVHCGASTNASHAAVTPLPCEPKKVNGFGVAGFVISLVSLCFGFYYCIAPVLAMIFSIIGMARYKNYNLYNGLALAGLIISIISLTFWIFMFIFMYSVLWLFLLSLGIIL